MKRCQYVDKKGRSLCDQWASVVCDLELKTVATESAIWNGVIRTKCYGSEPTELCYYHHKKEKKLL